MMACAGLCACSSDDIDLGSTSTSKVFEGDVAYLKVNLSEVGASSTRATYDYGTGTEATIKTANFYFYDGNGHYITEGEISGQSQSTFDVDDWVAQSGETAGSAETVNSNVVLLEGLTGKNYPKYVVTLINQPDGISAPYNLSDWLNDKRDDYENSDGAYMMSTSSYFDFTEGADNTYYYATALDDGDFATESSAFVENNGTATGANPVNIYVERLASKVSVELNNSLDVLTGGKGYTLKETLGATVNEDGEQVDENETNLSVHLLNWGLNGTSKNIYLMKHLNTEWTADCFSSWSSGWNDADNGRSYWAQGCTYDDNGIPTEDYGVDGLDYISFNDISNTLTSGSYCTPAYCLENTTTTTTSPKKNTTGIISDKYSPAITSILVAAQITEEGADVQSFIRYKGILYRGADIYSAISYANNIFTTESHKVLNGDYVKFKSNGDGTVTAYLTEGSSGTKTFYKYDGTAYDDLAAAQAQLDNDIDPDSGTDETPYAQEMTYYYHGYMYYMIPIKHLNDNDEEDSTLFIDEGDYGIVRNHYYKIYISDITNLGSPVYDPDETIYPSESTVAQASYQINSVVSVLSYNEVDVQSEDGSAGGVVLK